MKFKDYDTQMITIVPIHDTSPIFIKPKPVLGTMKIRHQPIINQIANHRIYNTTSLVFFRTKSKISVEFCWDIYMKVMVQDIETSVLIFLLWLKEMKTPFPGIYFS